MITGANRSLPRRLAVVLRRRGGLVVAVLICCVFGYVMVESLGFTEEARRAPLVVAVPALVAAAVLTAKELISPTAPTDAEQRAGPPVATTERPARVGTSTAAALGWVLLLAAMFLMLGLLATILLFTVIFMRVYGKERWRTVAITTAAVFGIVYVFFVEVLSVQVFAGWAWQWLARF